MIQAIAAVADLLLRAIEGLWRFLGELLPEISRLVFVLSPFILLVVLAYALGESTAALSVLAIEAVILIIGLAVSSRYSVTEGRLSLRTVVAVIAMDACIVLVLVILSGSSLPFKASLPLTATTMTPGKEQSLMKLLDEALGNGDTTGLHRALKELLPSQSQALVPRLIRVLRHYYPLVLSEAEHHAQRKAVVLLSLEKLAALRASESCDLLFEIAIKAETDAIIHAAKNASNSACTR